MLYGQTFGVALQAIPAIPRRLRELGGAGDEPSHVALSWVMCLFTVPFGPSTTPPLWDWYFVEGGKVCVCGMCVWHVCVAMAVAVAVAVAVCVPKCYCLVLANSSRRGVLLPRRGFSVEAIDNVMKHGHKNRTVGATLMNAESSRSHSIFTIIIEVRTHTHTPTPTHPHTRGVLVGTADTGHTSLLYLGRRTSNRTTGRTTSRRAS